MIRHPDLTFSRPLSEREIIAKIESGEVKALDELAPSAGYWFTLKDVEEVKKHFGENIILKALIPTDVETTSSTNPSLKSQKTKAISAKLPKLNKEPPPARRKMKAGAAHEGIPKILFASFLVLIFLGTLFLLWLGSQ
jgi:hypothetical protein